MADREQDRSAGGEYERVAQRGGGDARDVLPESGMGGTSDAGTAADDAAEAAALRRGLPGDATRGSERMSGGSTGSDQGTRGTSGGTTAPEEIPPTTELDDESTEQSYRGQKDPGSRH